MRVIVLFISEVIEEDVGGLVQVIVGPDQRLLHSLAGEAHVSESLMTTS